MEQIKYFTTFAGSNKRVACLGLGTVKIGRNIGVKYPNGEGAPLPTDAEVDLLLNQAIELGINLIDTAPAYGIAEERLGKIMGNRRDKFFLVSKAGENFNSQSNESHYDFSESALTISLERSLKLLKTDYLDCLMLHCNSNDYDTLINSPALETLIKLKENGKILSTGVSIHTDEAGQYAIKHCDALMIAYNSQFQKHHEVILSALENKKSVLLKKAFMSGHISPEQNYENLKTIVQQCPEAIIVAGTTKPERLQSNVAILNQL